MTTTHETFATHGPVSSGVSGDFQAAVGFAYSRIV